MPSADRTVWTLTHSFFVHMGGFVFEVPFTEDEHMTLTANGVLNLAKLRYKLPKVTAKAIEDRSKADTLAKVISCIQAGYLILGVLSRLITHLPITLLEVNTLGHVICALVMYAFWLHKPLNVEDPVVIKNQMTDAVGALASLDKFGYRWEKRAAFFEFLDRLQEENHSEGPDDWTANIYLSHRLPFETDRSQDDPSGNHAFVRVNTDLEMLAHGVQKTGTVEKKEIEFKTGLPGDEEMETWKAGEIVLILFSVTSTEQEIQEEIKGYELWSQNLTRIYLISGADRDSLADLQATFKEIRENVRCTVVCLSSTRNLGLWNQAYEIRRLKLVPDTDVVPQSENWPGSYKGGMPVEREWLMILTIAAVTGLYGGLHALQWHAHFPSTPEKLLWRISSLIIAASGIAAVCFMLASNFQLLKKIGGAFDRFIIRPLQLWRYTYRGKRWYKDEEESRTGKALTFFAALLAVIIVLMYIGARCFIVTEAFISLRSQPEAAYSTPNWNNFWPHL